MPPVVLATHGTNKETRENLAPLGPETLTLAAALARRAARLPGRWPSPTAPRR